MLSPAPRRPWRRILATGLALSLALSACAPRLSVAPLESQGLRVTAVSKAPSGFAPDIASAERKALWQAARATLDSGHRYFRIVGRDVTTRKAGGYGLGLVGGHYGAIAYSGSHHGSDEALAVMAAVVILVAFDLVIYGLTYSDAKAEAVLLVRVGPVDGPPHGETGLIDAAALIENWPALPAALQARGFPFSDIRFLLPPYPRLSPMATDPGFGV